MKRGNALAAFSARGKRLSRNERFRHAAGRKNQALPIPGISRLDDDARRRARLAAARHLIAHARGDRAVNLGVRAVRLGGDDRKAGVRCLANFDFERDLAEERNAQAFRLGFGAAMTEWVRALAAMR